MASHINRGETLLIPFENGQSIYDSQLRPRMYKSMQALEKALPKHFRDTYKVEVVEYAEVKHGYWKDRYNNKYYNHLYECSVCGREALYECYTNVLGQWSERQALTPVCPHCGAKMTGGRMNEQE